jgi:hypothetical protein
MHSTPWTARSTAIVCATVMSLALGLAADARANPKFEGHWELDTEASQNIPAVLKAVEQDVTVVDGNVSISRTFTPADPNSPPGSVEYTYIVNGEAHSVANPPGSPEPTREVTAEWKGKKLVVEWIAEFRGMDIPIKETWKTRKKGLEVKRTITTPNRNVVQKFQFVRP